MDEYSRIIIEEYCMQTDSTKSRRLEKLVRKSYDINAEYTDSDSAFIKKVIETLKSILGDDAIDIQHIGSTAIQAIRDYLNANENVALQYQKLKEELESKYADDRVTYTN